MTSVACVGIGNIGRSWALAFAKGGCDVAVYDENRAALRASLDIAAGNAQDLAAAGLIEDADAVMARISAADTLEAALHNAVYVQESVREDLDLKRRMFAAMDELASPDVILASSSSEFMSSQFIDDVTHVERCLVAHPFNPPYLIPLVELSGHPQTAREVIGRARALLAGIGMSPVEVRKEIKGFLLNRLQAAVVGESLQLVGEGYCTAEDLDRAMTDGLGLRWAFMGPFMTGHLNASDGYRSYMRLYGDTYRRIADDLQTDYGWSLDLIDRIADEMEQTFAQKQVVDGQRWRDRRLMALLEHRRDAKPPAT